MVRDKQAGALGKLNDKEHDVYRPLKCTVYLLTYLITYSMKVSLSREANRHSITREITRILCDP